MKRILFSVPILLFAMMGLKAQPGSRPDALLPEKLLNQKLVERFYELKGQSLFWFHADAATGLREKFCQILDSAAFLALDKNKYHYPWLKQYVYFSDADTLQLITADKIFTDAAISFCKDLYQGTAIDNYINYDEISSKYEASGNGYILMGLSAIHSENELEWFVNFLQPSDKEYTHMKAALRKAIDSAANTKVKQLRQSVNLLRWIKHFNFYKYIVVNTASAVVRYYECDTVAIRMKAVVGKSATPTPQFAGYCNEVILYPYWNVPYSIAVNEILPIVKRNRSYLNSRNLQLIDGNGKVLDPSSVNWSGLSARNFPYRFRQSTGCDNALGVIKFNLTDPFSVYMHDTNSKTAFLAGSRYFSHGCIRLEKPVELAMVLLPGKIDTGFLESCIKNQKPVQMKLEQPIPVFVVYMTSEYDQDGQVKFYKDVYKLLR